MGLGGDVYRVRFGFKTNASLAEKSGGGGGGVKRGETCRTCYESMSTYDERSPQLADPIEGLSTRGMEHAMGGEVEEQIRSRGAKLLAS